MALYRSEILQTWGRSQEALGRDAYNEATDSIYLMLFEPLNPVLHSRMLYVGQNKPNVVARTRWAEHLCGRRQRGNEKLMTNCLDARTHRLRTVVLVADISGKTRMCPALPLRAVHERYPHRSRQWNSPENVARDCLEQYFIELGKKVAAGPNNTILLNIATSVPHYWQVDTPTGPQRIFGDVTRLLLGDAVAQGRFLHALA